MTRPTSLVLGRDRDVLPLLFDVHAPAAPRVLDVTFNRGAMWQRSGLAPDVRMDISPELSPDADVIGDFMAMPFAGGSFDVIVFDPPHLPTSVATASSWGHLAHYGLTGEGAYRQGLDVSPGFAPFLAEAQRVLRPGGVVFAKIADLVNARATRWQHVDFINACAPAGLMACDLIVKADPSAGKLMSSTWKQTFHFRKAHSYWIVARKGRCERHDRRTDAA